MSLFIDIKIGIQINCKFVFDFIGLGFILVRFRVRSALGLENLLTIMVKFGSERKQISKKISREKKDLIYVLSMYSYFLWSEFWSDVNKYC